MGFLVSAILVVLAFAAGYLSCLWWGKPARLLKKAAEKGIDVAKEVTGGMR